MILFWFFYIYIISLITSFSLNSQTPAVLYNPQFGKPWRYIVFNALNVVNVVQEFLLSLSLFLSLSRF